MLPVKFKSSIRECIMAATPEEYAAMRTEKESRLSLKTLSLIILTVQNSAFVLVMRYVRTRKGDIFISSTGVVVLEFIKFFVCFLILLIQSGGMQNWLQYMKQNVIQQPKDCFKMSVVSFAYVLQNNLLYLAISNLDPAVFQVSYQSKILTTAVFYVLILNKHLSNKQWFSLVTLFMGVVIVQMQHENQSSNNQVSTEQEPFLGFLAVGLSSILSGLSGVYLESVLKESSKSCSLRNVQLGANGVIFGLVTMGMKDGASISTKGFFFGYDGLVLYAICLQAFGGLMITVVLQYADNILKGFSTSASIVLSCIASVYLFDFKVSTEFLIGASLVTCSVYMYNRYKPKHAGHSTEIPKKDTSEDLIIV